MKNDLKSTFIKVWEGIGIASIILLLCLPNGKTVINTVLMMTNVRSEKYMGLSVADLAAMIIFLVVYFSSFKFFSKDRATKMFSLLASILMIITLISRIIFA